jgi:DNA-binding response OmpR family regulator
MKNLSKHVRLNAKESSLLELLMRNYGIVLSKERIFEKFWGYHSDIQMGTRCIKAVRSIVLDN